MSLTSSQKRLLKSLKIVAKDLGENGRSLTGLIGELSVCDILDMKWLPETGYDCIDNKNNNVEIKTRRGSKGSEVDKRGRLGKFGKRGNYRFAYGLYVELNPKFEVVNIYKLSKRTIKILEQKENDRGLHISTFVNNKKRERVFPID